MKLFSENYKETHPVLKSLKNLSGRMLFLFLLVLSFEISPAQTFNPDDLLKPRTGVQTLVNDFAGILTADQKHALEQKLVAFDDSTSTQVAVVIVPDLGSYDVSDYNTRLGRAWGVGGKEFSNGVILLISRDDRKLNIATGYGVEGALPDITAKHIIDEVIVPNFKGNDYFRGIDEGTDAIIKAVQGEYKVPRKKSGKAPGSAKMIGLIVFLIIFLIMRSGGNNKGGGFMSRRGYRGLGTPIFWPGGFGGSGGGGGSSGGGFGGFGGGSFGGGGASGSW